MVENNVTFFYFALVYTIPLVVGGLAILGLAFHFFARRSKESQANDPGDRSKVFPLALLVTAGICLGYVIDDVGTVVRPFMKTAENMCEIARASSSVKQSLIAPAKRVSITARASNCLSCHHHLLKGFPGTTFIITNFSRPGLQWAPKERAKFRLLPADNDVELSLGEMHDQACFYPIDLQDRDLEAFAGRCIIARPKSDAPADVSVTSLSTSTKTGNMEASRSVLIATSALGEILYYGEDIFLDGNGSTVLTLRHIFGGITNYTCRNGGIPSAAVALQAIWPKPN